MFGNTSGGGAPEIAGPFEEDVTVTYSDVCDLPQKPAPPVRAPIEGTGNICEDPLLAGATAAAGADVHQTLGSPTYDRVPSDQGDVLVDYEGDVRPILSSTRSATPFGRRRREGFSRACRTAAPARRWSRATSARSRAARRAS